MGVLAGRRVRAALGAGLLVGSLGGAVLASEGTAGAASRLTRTTSLIVPASVKSAGCDRAGKACGTARARAAANATNPMLYWANASGNTIGEADLNGTHVDQSFIRGADGPSDVVVYGQYIYWANATGCTADGSCPGTIGRAELNGTHADEHFVPADTPYGLAIEGNYIYWSNYGSNSIGRANLNGTHVDQTFITTADEPDGVAVNGQSIYWANFSTNSIGRADLNGTHVDQTFITGTTQPEGMAIDGGSIYWVNHGAHSIGEATLAGGGVNERFIADAGAWPTRVTVSNQHIYWTTWTTNAVPSSGTIGEADLNGTGVNNQLVRSANTPVGVAVS